MARIAIPDFRKEWESIGSEAEVIETFGLSFKSVEDGVNGVVKFLGMKPYQGTDTVKEEAKQHQILLSGVFIGGVKVVARGQIGMTDEHGCVLKLQIRSEDDLVSTIVAECIQ